MGTCIGLFCGNYINYFLLTWLPFYLVREQHFTMVQMAKIGGAGYLISACAALISGALSDHWIRAGGSPTLVRKMFVAGGTALAGMFIGLASLAGPQMCIALLWVGLFCFGASSSNVFAISQRLAGPHAAGRWVGFQNAFGNLAGVVVPVVTGVVLGRTGHFYWAFLIMSMVALAGAASWTWFVGPIEQVAWGKGPRALSAGASPVAE